MIKDTVRLAQITHPQKGRRVALVQEPNLIILKDIQSIYDLAFEAIRSGKGIFWYIEERTSDEKLNYDLIYSGDSEWKLLPAFDQPENPMNCLVSGTGLTHKNSALNRQMMHQETEWEKLTDSMQIYQWGLEGGQPKPGETGVQPEWFYKGTGVILRAHGEALDVPGYANDGGEEPEVAGVYIIDPAGVPWRIGFCTANEFSDHVMEKKNYLYLAPSKLRNCAIGPELVLDAAFDDISGRVAVIRDGEALWSRNTKTGQNNMAHNLANLEYHHFKYASHRVPFQSHIHFYGADAFSFGAQIALRSGDEMIVEWEHFGRALKNPLNWTKESEQLVPIRSFKK